MICLKGSVKNYLEQLIAKNLNFDDYQRWLAWIVYRFFDKKAATHRETGLVSDVVFENQKLTKELHQPIISKFKGRTVH